MTDDWTTRFRIYKNAYDKRINVHLFNAESSDTYKTFQKNLANNLFSQVEYVASDIETLYVLSKAASVELLGQVGGLVAKYELSKKLGLNLFMYWAGEQGGQAAMDKLGINGVFGLQNPKFLQYFDQSANLVITSVDNTTKEWIAEKIADGKRQGLTPFQISNNLVDQAKGISKMRAEMIVLTETAKAMNTVEMEASKAYGIQEVVWRVSRDERVCPICLPLEGEIAKVGNLFKGGYSQPAHPRCRCYIEQIIPQDWLAPENLWTGN